MSRAPRNLLTGPLAGVEVLSLDLRVPLTPEQYLRAYQRDTREALGDELVYLLMEVGAVDIEVTETHVDLELWERPGRQDVLDVLRIIHAYTSTNMKVATIRRRYVRPETL